MKKIDKNVVALGWVSFFTDMASAMINPILPVFVVTILHQSMAELGMVVAAATFVSYMLRILSGYISDRFGIVKPLVVGGYTLSALCKPLLGFTHDYKSVAVLRSLERFGKGLRSAPKDLMLASYGEKSGAGKTFGFHKTLDIAGELAGAVIVLLILYSFGEYEETIRGIFFATLIPGLIGLFIVLFFVRDIPKAAHSGPIGFRLTAKDKKTIRSLIFYFLFLLFMFNEAFFTIQAKDVGIPMVLIPVLFIVSTSIQTLTSYLFGVWIDRVGAKRILVFSYLCGTAAQGLLYLQKPLFTWVSFAFLGLFSVSSLNANRSIIANRAENRGSVYGIFYALVAIFAALGAYISGFVWDHLGIDMATLLALGGTSAVFVSYLLSLEKL